METISARLGCLKSILDEDTRVKGVLMRGRVLYYPSQIESWTTDVPPETLAFFNVSPAIQAFNRVLHLWMRIHRPTLWIGGNRELQVPSPQPIYESQRSYADIVDKLGGKLRLTVTLFVFLFPLGFAPAVWSMHHNWTPSWVLLSPFFSFSSSSSSSHRGVTKLRSSNRVF